MTLVLKGERFFRQGFDIFLNRETENFDTAMHGHDFVELSLVAEGRGCHYVEDKTACVRKGDLFVLPVGTKHVFRPASPDQAEPLVVLNCIFDVRILDRLRLWVPEQSELDLALSDPDAEKEASSTRWLHFFDRHGQFDALFSQAYREYSEESAGYRGMVTALLLQMLQLVQRGLLEKTLAESDERQPLADAGVEEALRFIERHYSDKITLKELADRAYMSVGHFQNQFKKATGQTLNHYVQNVRIAKCCRILATTDKSVQQTANEVGYSDMKFFHSLFRKITGSSPQQYRRLRA